MRNLLEHPVTMEEVHSFLEGLALQYAVQDREICGSMASILLSTAAQLIVVAEALHDSLNEPLSSGRTMREQAEWAASIDEALMKALGSRMPKGPTQ